jgi:sulfofructosephosphate aldolase
MTSLTELARPSGGLAMVAMDQRESLRAMLGAHSPAPVPDSDLTKFKLAVATELGEHASGFLIDRDFGFDQVLAERLLPPSCGLILAADRLQHPPEGGQVVETTLDEDINPAHVRERGVVAMKLLLVWRPDEHRDARLAMAEEFVRRCSGAGLLSILEGVVRPTSDDDFDRLQLEAAAELGALRPSLYKAQVPRRGHGERGEVARVCERITATVPVPWVVLSQGVTIEDFPHAVRTACGAGASGFLAGRAIWSDTLSDPAPLLRSRAVDRLKRLAEVVDSSARPWQEAAA